jgi:hypothetical protein
MLKSRHAALDGVEQAFVHRGSSAADSSTGTLSRHRRRENRGGGAAGGTIARLTHDRHAA